MSIYTAVENIIRLAETANDANYHEKLDVIVKIAKAVKMQLDDDNETAIKFDELEDPES